MSEDLQEAEKLARRFHETYERLAPIYNYETRKASAVPWEQVPENNKLLMIAVAGELLESWPRGQVPASSKEVREQLRQLRHASADRSMSRFPARTRRTEPMRHVSINGHPGYGNITIDGHDISRAVRAYTVEHAARDVPVVTINLNVYEHLQLDERKARVQVPDDTHDVLVMLGWTPPAEDA